jgi:hypothetical protein
VQAALLNALDLRRPLIRRRWEDLLRAERVSTPLGNPDALVHLLGWTLDEIFRTLHALPSRRKSLRTVALDDDDCPCGRNPLITYFAAGEQAMQESLILTQAAGGPLPALERDAALDEVNFALRHIARREINAFCALCRFRETACLPCAFEVPV